MTKQRLRVVQRDLFEQLDSTRDLMIDQKQLIGQVAAKNGIRLEPDDPAFALVTLNEAASGRVGGSDAGDSAGSQQFHGITGEDGAQGYSTRPGCEDGCRRARRELNADVERASLKANDLVMKVSAANARPAIVKWAAVGSLAALLLFLCGVVVGLKMVEH